MSYLKSLINISPRYQRALTLSTSSYSSSSIDGYIITDNISLSIDRILKSIRSNTSCRSFTLFGPFGSGKSSFAVFLTQLLSIDQNISSAAFRLLNEQTSTFTDEFLKIRGNGFFIIPITANKQAPGLVLCRGILQSLSKLPDEEAKHYIDEIQSIIDNEAWKDSDTILKFLEKLKNFIEGKNFSGILLIMDEAGKMLEYALQDSYNGDVYIFQQIAEFVNNIKYPFLFIIVLHQLFDEYVEIADKTLRAEWNKIQERFEQIYFVESNAVTMNLIASSIQHPNGVPDEVIRNIDQEVCRLKDANIVLPNGFTYKYFKELSIKAWPIHPLSLLILPWLFRKIGQNERSIFTWLNSNEPESFQNHLDTANLQEDSAFIRLYHLYRFFMINYFSSLVHQPSTRVLNETEDTINSHPNLSIDAVKILSSIGILNIPGVLSLLGKSENALICSLPNPEKAKIEIENLEKNSIIIHRNFDSSYRIWEGSDIDIEERIREAHSHVKNDPMALISDLKKLLPARRIVARKHMIQSGNYRYFDVLYCSDLKTIPTTDTGASGFVAVIFPLRTIDALKEDALEITAEREDIVVAIPHQMDVVLNLTEELVCLQWVELNTPELRNDNVARRELNARNVICHTKLNKYIQPILDPRKPPIGSNCHFFWRGQELDLRNPTDLIRQISKICDHLYPLAPRVRNELIVRQELSTAVTSARRIVMEGILGKEEEPALGIQGFPPEMSIYASFLKAGNLHIYDSSDMRWHICLPDKNNDVLNLLPCFEFMEKEIFNVEAERIKLTTLFQKMAERPYGIANGLHPLFFLIFWKLNSANLFIYRENSFVPDPTKSVFELLPRRPDLFSVSGIKLTGVKKDIILSLANMLDAQPDIVSVVKKFVFIMQSLPAITMHSQKISDDAAKQVRNVYQRAQEPEQLIFVELPKCFGLPSFMRSDVKESEIEEFTLCLKDCLELFRQFAVKQELQCRNILLSACGLNDSDDGWNKFLDIGKKLATSIKDSDLSPILNSFLQDNNKDITVQRVLSYLGKKSFEFWTDADLLRFEGLANTFGERFKYFCNSICMDALLSDEDLQNKQKVVLALQEELEHLKQNEYSDHVIKAAIQQIMYELTQKEGNVNGLA